MIQEERVSKLVTEILELKDWNNWSAIPWNYKRGGEGGRGGRGGGGGQVTSTVCCVQTSAILVNISHLQDLPQET